ncbi:MAG: carcinine hydrolase/isopenicillin-N N-acyltransferase family protein [Alloprevotella sp.]
MDKQRTASRTVFQTWKTLFLSIPMLMAFNACSDDEVAIPRTPVPTENKAEMVTDEDKRAMIYSLVDLEGNKGRIYEMNYNVDYKLEDALNFEIDCTQKLQQFAVAYLMDERPSPSQNTKITYDAGCSAFACPDISTGDFLMGRNFDFNHIDPDTKERHMIPVIAVHTAPVGGKKSVSFVDGQFVGYDSGFYNDGKSDLSMLMALPYLLLDGINEDGFAVCVLKLDGLNTEQEEENRKKIFTTVAMRMLLDKASNVQEAMDLLEKYNMTADKAKANYHFFMADAKGDYAIVEYTDADTLNHPNTMERLEKNDTLRCVTNFYVSPTMANTKHGINQSEHGMDRYKKLRSTLQQYNYQLTSPLAMWLLSQVAQGPENPELSTGFTQWSEVFNLTRKTVTMSILREYNHAFSFQVE